MRYLDIEMAFEFVSAGSRGEHSIVINRDTGQMLHNPGPDDNDEIAEYEAQGGDPYSDPWVAVPHKNELDLGNRLVFRFAAEHLSDADYDRVRDIFGRRGAYGRFGDFLFDRGMLDEWHAYEQERKEEALRRWCADEGVELED